jgi:hypothetical protein
MKASTMRLSTWWRQILPVIFVLGVILLLGTWALLYEAESLFTESHLVGYYCCVSEQDLPAIGTWERSLSDFFRSFPGKHLPSLLFVSIAAGISIRTLVRARGKVWLPALFAVLNLAYLSFEHQLVKLSWSISNRVVGPVTSAYKGYQRTWYGITLHFLAMGVLILSLAWLGRALASRAEERSGTGVPESRAHDRNP